MTATATFIKLALLFVRGKVVVEVTLSGKELSLEKQRTRQPTVNLTPFWYPPTTLKVLSVSRPRSNGSIRFRNATGLPVSSSVTVMFRLTRSYTKLELDQKLTSHIYTVLSRDEDVQNS